MLDRRDTRQVGCRREKRRKGGFRIGGMQKRKDAGEKGYRN